MQPFNWVYYSKIYWRLNVFQAAYRSSSGPSINFGIINSITRLHLISCFYWFILRCTDPWILNIKFLAFYGTRRFITAFTSARHLPRILSQLDPVHTSTSCVLFKDNNRAIVAKFRARNQFSSLSLCTTRTTPQCQMLVVHPAFKP